MVKNNIIEDVQQYRKLGEEERRDLKDFIQRKDLDYSDEKNIKIPIKIVKLPEFEYDMRDKVKMKKDQEDGQEGEDEDGEEEKEGEEKPGDEGREELKFQELDVEEFAERMEEIMDLDLEPKGKKSTEKKDGDLTDISNTGPKSTLIEESMIKKGINRQISFTFDKNYAVELLRVKNVDPKRAFHYLRNKNHNVNFDFLENQYEDILEKRKYESIEEFEENNTPERTKELIKKENFSDYFRKEDEEYLYPEKVLKEENNVVIFNIRDASASMKRSSRRELLQRTFAPIDWTLAGKYDKAEFVYIVHDTQASEVNREKFFKVKSGKGTKVSSAYELTKEKLDKEYPWSEWNRYILAGGDGENKKRDTKQNVVPLMEEIKANLHAYIQVRPSKSRSRSNHKKVLENNLDMKNFIGVEIEDKDEIWNGIKKVFQKEVEIK